jgi:hypothetical protein
MASPPGAQQGVEGEVSGMKQVLALAVGVLAAAAIAQAAMAANDEKVTLGPSGYDVHGKATLVVAGTANVDLGHDDRVVICRAKKSGWEQHARPAEHAVEGKDAAGDIVPPFVVVSNKGQKDTSMAAGQNWTAANAALYANDCSAPATSSAPVAPGASVSAPTQTVPATTVVIEKIVVQIKTTPAKKAVKKAKRATKAKKHAVKKHAAKKHKARKHRKINRAREARDTGAVSHRR